MWQFVHAVGHIFLGCLGPVLCFDRRVTANQNKILRVSCFILSCNESTLMGVAFLCKAVMHSSVFHTIPLSDLFLLLFQTLPKSDQMTGYLFVHLLLCNDTFAHHALDAAPSGFHIKFHLSTFGSAVLT